MRAILLRDVSTRTAIAKMVIRMLRCYIISTSYVCDGGETRCHRVEY